MAGMTFLRLMAAVLRTPQRSLLDMMVMIKPDNVFWKRTTFRGGKQSDLGICTFWEST
jgi:hypothetical protein